MLKSVKGKFRLHCGGCSQLWFLGPDQGLHPETSGSCCLWWPTTVLRQLGLLLQYTTVFWVRENPNTDGFHHPLLKDLPSPKPLSFPVTWGPCEFLAQAMVSINIRIKTHLSHPRTEFWLWYLNRVRNIFCLFLNSEYCVPLIPWHPLKQPPLSPQEHESPLLLPFLTSPAPSINDCSAHLQRARSTSS